MYQTQSIMLIIRYISMTLIENGFYNIVQIDKIIIENHYMKRV